MRVSRTFGKGETDIMDSKFIYRAFGLCMLAVAVLVVISVFSMSSDDVSAETENITIDGVTYEYTYGSGDATVIGFTDQSDVTIPAEIAVDSNSYSVTTVGNGSRLTGVDVVRNIEFGSNVQEIKRFSFMNSGLQNITFGTGIKYIRDHAFCGCTEVSMIYFYDGLEIIESEAFSNCSSIALIHFPSSLYSISVGSFSSVGNGNMILSVETNALWGSESTISNSAFDYIFKDMSGNVISFDSYSFPGHTYVLRNTYMEATTTYTCGKTVANDVKAVFYPDNTMTFFGIGDMYDATNPSYIPWIAVSDQIQHAEFYPGITSVGEFSLSSCNLLSSVKLSETIRTIGSYSFTNCPHLSSINFPDALTSIGISAFSGCTSIESLTLSENLTEICSNAFYNCTGLTSIILPDSSFIIGDSAFDMNSCSGTSLTTLDLGGVTYIGNTAFRGCACITSIEIPSTVESVGQYAFAGCSDLASVVININDHWNSLNVDSTCFGDALFSLYGSDDIIDVRSRDGCSYSFSSDRFVLIEREYAIGEDDEKAIIATLSFSSGIMNVVGSGTMKGWSDSAPWIYDGSEEYLTTVNLDSRIPNIGDRAFYSCSNLATINLQNITSVGAYSLCMCSVSGDLDLSGMTEIGVSAFGSCNNISKITLGGNISVISDNAFGSCTCLRTIIVNTDSNWDPSHVSQNAFYGKTFYSAYSTVIDCNSSEFDGYTYSGSSVYLGREYTFNVGKTVADDVVARLNVYSATLMISTEKSTAQMTDYTEKSNAPWKDYSNSIRYVIFGDNVINAGSYAFYQCTSTMGVTFSNYVTAIGSYAFAGCFSICNLTLPKSDICIGANAFDSCISLTNVTVSSKTVSIDENAFTGCSKLTTINIGSALTSISTMPGVLLLKGCNKFSSYVVDTNNKTFSSLDGVLYNKSKTELISSPCASPTSCFTIPESVIGIWDCAFYENSNLTQFMMGGTNLTTIGASAFYGCSNVEEVELPGSVTSIGAGAFYGCSSLSEVILPSNLYTLGDSAFMYTNAIVYVQSTNPSSLTPSDSTFSGARYIFVPEDTLASYRSSWTAWSSMIFEPIVLPAGTSYDYDGSTHQGIADSTKYTLSGTVTAKDAACEMETTVTPNDGYRWADDGSASSKTSSWSIEPVMIYSVEIEDRSRAYDGTAYSEYVIDTEVNNERIKVRYLAYSKDIGTYVYVDSDTPQEGQYAVIFADGPDTDPNKGKASNYVIWRPAMCDIPFTISKKQITVTPDSGLKKNYGFDDPVLTYSHTGEIDGEEALFTNELTRESGETVNEGGYNILKGDLELSDNGSFLAKNYSISFTENVAFTIQKATPVIEELPTASAISYGQHLSDSEITGGTVTNNGNVVSGSFYWYSDYICPYVSDSQSTLYTVVFLPSDTDNFNESSAQIKITVNKTTPQITALPTASSITYEDTLSVSTFSGGGASNPMDLSVPVEGTFAWSDPSYVPTVAEGEDGFDVIFTPEDTDNYETATVTVSVNIQKNTPIISDAPNASPIYYGQRLSDSTLSGGSVSADGAFTWYESGDIQPSVSDSCRTLYGILFIPDDEDNYEYSATDVQIEVYKSTPSVRTSPSASEITYGQTLAASSLSGWQFENPYDTTKPMFGTLVWYAPATLPSVSDSQSTSFGAVFTPQDTVNYYETTIGVKLTINKATPSVTCVPSASPITYEDTLSMSTLTGGSAENPVNSAAVEGTFAWSDPSYAPTVAEGAAGLSVTFTPSDSNNYNTATAAVTVSVAKKDTSVTEDPVPSEIYYGLCLSDSVLNGGSATAPGVFSWTDGTIMPTVADSQKTLYAVTFTPDDTDNYNGTSTSVKITVNKTTSASVTGKNVSFTYDSEEHSVLVSDLTATGLVSGDTLTSAEFGGCWKATDRTDASVYTVTSVKIMRGETDVTGNYTLTLTGGTFQIDRKVITAGPGTKVPTKIYDGSAIWEQTGDYYSFDTLCGSDDVTLISTSEFDTSGVSASVVTVSISGIGGKDADNYTLITESFVILGASITPKDIDVAPVLGYVPSKTYDGTLSWVPESVCYEFTGIIGQDDIVLTASYTFDSKDALTASEVIASGLGLSGDDADNYSLTTESFVLSSAEITKRVIIVTPVADQSKSFGDKDPVLKYGFSNTVPGEIPATNGALSRASGEDIGRYQIFAGSVELTDDASKGFSVSNYSMVFSIGKSFEIKTKDITKNDFTIDLSDVTYDGKAKTKEITSKLVLGVDYTVSYSDNVNAGTAKILISGKGNYSGSVEYSFTIAKMYVDVPAPLYYISTGERIDFKDFPVSDKYSETSGNARYGTAAGTYPYKLELSDPANYVWKDTSFDGKYYVYITVEKKIYTEEGKTIAELEFTESGVRVDGEIQLKGTSDVSEETKIILKDVSGNAEYSYDIKIVADGKEIQPAGKVTIRVLIPDNMENVQFRLYHIHGGVAEKVDYQRDGDYAVFTVDSFSEFVFVRGTSAEYTADNTLYIALGVAAGIAFVLLAAYLIVRRH